MRLEPDLSKMTVEDLYELINDPNTLRTTRVQAKARVKALSGLGNREVRRSWAHG